MDGKKVLVVDDEKSIANPVAYAFRREGFIVETAFDGIEAVEKVNVFKPDFLVIDVMMPKLNGFEVLKRIGDIKRIGVIFLSAKRDIIDRLIGLELGADDYITKPFDVREVIAKVRALNRRIETSNINDHEVIQSGELSINITTRIVTLNGEEIEFTSKEFDLLYILMRNPGMVFTRQGLLDKVWDIYYAGETRTVDIHVLRIRKKLGDKYCNSIQTVYGYGYKFMRYANE